ncbi:DUF885 domain-containing protein [Pseudoalteromonas aurantia]|uniref:DUF885 domain-containing protein n=1 Tax=Pseudoalteromonas aurantia 208 TaxID=1314867 RepID=A0ABR9EI20_9GAMM|nr:DUF885 domain-containing protein [Pseudoalteromonas aurantia]MBE0369875.1 hypothetical protein [Pseudoalteromonas aurantia 208]
MRKTLINYTSISLLALCLSACQLTPVNVDAQFTHIAQEVETTRKSNNAYARTQISGAQLLPDLSAEGLAKNYHRNVQFLHELDKLPLTKMSDENQINHTILRAQIQNQVDQYRFHSHYIPLTSEYGFHSSMSFMVAGHDFAKLSGYELYLSRLQQIPRYFAQNIMWMKKGVQVGMTQPKIVLAGYEESITAFIVPNVVDSEFYAPFLVNSAKLPAADFEKLQQRAQDVITEQVLPAYQNYLRFFVDEYRPAAREEIGISATKNGESYYANRVRHYTTTDMTAKEIHELGLQEVARIRSEMQNVIQESGFEGTFAEFVDFLRTDPQFYATTPEQLLKEAAFIAKKMDAQLPKLFHTLPRRPYGVEPVPASIAPKYTTGRYSGASKDDEAGFYWVNTYALDKRPLYVLEALTLHEAVPGHHLQIALNAELDYLPDYRRNTYISAFGEGWGLYSEYLGLEAGFYKDPYSNFGRLTYEMWRAARLVVDTGMHMFGWSREQAMNFMKDNSALSLHNIKTETDRYISWPGQALSYKIGELTIKRLRQEAEEALGQEFDIREFHHQILRHGSVPLFVLEEQVRRYIQTELAKPQG